MRLRNLELKDATLMLEWMHDENVVGKLKGDFLEKTLHFLEVVFQILLYLSL